MKFRLSVDDGCASDVRIADLCKKYGIECIFYWPIEHRSLAYSNGYKPLDYNQQFYIAYNLGFEVGAHGLTHQHITKLDIQTAAEEIIEPKYLLKRLFGKEITKYAPPRGYTNDVLTKIAMKNYEEQRLTRGEGLVHIHPNSGANNNKPWRDCVDENTKELWAHSWELDKYDMWDELEEFLSGKS